MSTQHTVTCIMCISQTTDISRSYGGSWRKCSQEAIILTTIVEIVISPR